MSNYTFFFDESFHDREIGLSDDGSFNFMKDSSSDVYVGVFWGVRTKKITNTKSMIETFEIAQKQRYGLGEEHELKTTTIKKGNFKYGLRSLNRDAYCFYNELFDLIHNIMPVMQITMISKMELYIRRFFQNVDMDFRFVKEELFYYSITKFIIVYGTEHLRNELLAIQTKSDMDRFVDLLIAELKNIINKTSCIPRKSREVEAFKSLILILGNAGNANGVVENRYPFEYRRSFDGLYLLLTEKRISIKTTEIVLDEEINTLKASQLYDFERTKGLKSHQSIELRLSDWIAGFVGRMIVALNSDNGLNEHYESREELNEKDIISKHLLSYEWFDINNDTFDLYKKAHQVYILDHESEYWAAMTGSFFDSTVLFYSLLRYFGSYSDYNSYKSVSCEMHAEYYNSCACDELSRAYGEV